jgi:tol-pal system protein YbgF
MYGVRMKQRFRPLDLRSLWLVPLALAVSGPGALAQQGAGTTPAPTVQQIGPTRAPDPAVTRLQDRITELEGELKAATDQVERLQFEVRQNKAELERQSRVLDDLLRRAGSSETPPVTDAPPTEDRPAAAIVLPDDPVGAYRTAYSLLTAGNYPGAENAFRQFITKFSSDAQVPDARYWLGESLFVQEAWREAANSYIQLLQTAPGATRAPDAMVRLATSLRQMGDTTRACAALSQFASTYPQAAPALRSRADAERRASACRV